MWKASIPAFFKEETNKKRRRLIFSDINFEIYQTELEIEIDPEKQEMLARFSVPGIAERLPAILFSQRFAYFIRDGKQYQVRRWNADPRSKMSLWIFGWLYVELTKETGSIG